MLGYQEPGLGYFQSLADLSCLRAHDLEAIAAEALEVSEVPCEERRNACPPRAGGD